MDVLGQAIYDFYFRINPSRLLIHNKFGKPDEMPVSVYFRDEDDMPDLELEALLLCRGSILDIGAGAGSHALYLQDRNKDVTALEISQMAALVMKKRGVEKIINDNIFNYAEKQFDTILLLMNGIGLAANLAGLKNFLQHCKNLLAPGGQLLFDSSDVAYLYKRNVPPMVDYYGEIDFRYEYKKQKTPWFSWLYIDRKTLKKIAEQDGWKTEILFDDDHDQYLVRLTLL